MRTWKHEAWLRITAMRSIAVIGIIALSLTLITCDDKSGDPDPVCGCTVKVHPNGSPCTCPAAGTSACDCTEEVESTFAQTVESYQHTTPDGKTMTVYYVLPPVVNSETKVIIVMHGTTRNATAYLSYFRLLSIIANYTVIAPEFSSENFPEAEYQRINIPGNISDYSKWSFHHIDRIFGEFVQQLGLSATKYILYGHSAGSQFTHRTLMFSKSPYLEYGIAANAGTYTFLSEEWNYGRGIKNLLSLKSDLLNSLANKKLYILIGSDDNDPNHPDLAHGDYDVQGLHRYDRAYNFYTAAKEYANQNGVNFNWELTEMPDVGHNASRTVPYVLDILTRNTRPATLAAASNLSGQERLYGTWYSNGNSVYSISNNTLTYVSSSSTSRFIVSINSFTPVTNDDSATNSNYPDGYRIRGVYTESDDSSRPVGSNFDYRFFPAADNHSMVRRGSTSVWNRY